MTRSPDAGEHGSVNVTDNHQSANECNDSFERCPLTMQYQVNHEIRIARAVHVD